MKYKLVQDNNGLWYCIPCRLACLFTAMAADEELKPAFDEKFGEYEIGTNPSIVDFENPEW